MDNIIKEVGVTGEEEIWIQIEMIIIEREQEINAELAKLDNNEMIGCLSNI